MSHTTHMNRNNNTAESLTVDMASMEVCRDRALELTVSPRHSVIGVGSSMSKTQVCATVTARKEHEDQQRAPVDILVALDNSASMQDGNKLPLCKKSLALLLRTLHADDRFGLVTFSDEAIVQIPIEKLSPEHKQKALVTVESLQTECSTNISAAIGLASQELRRVANPHAVRTIFLLTDGLANRGVCDPASLVLFTKSHCLVKDDCNEEASAVSEASWVAQFPMKVEVLDDKLEEPSEPSISLHCFGYGSGHDSRMLQGISEATPGGTYYFVEDDSNVLTAIGDALGGVISVVAQNAVLHFAVPNESKSLGAEIIQVHHKNKVLRQDGSFSISLGDFYAEESRDVIVEVKLATPPSNSTDRWITHATVSVSFTDTLHMESGSCPPTPCDISRLPGSGISAANQHVKVQWLRVRVTQAIAEADQLSQKGDIRAARAVISGMLEAIDLSADGEVRANPLVEQLIADLNHIQEGLVSRDAYTQYGGHRMQNTMQMHLSQRCNDSLGNFNYYRSPRKCKTLGKFTPK